MDSPAALLLGLSQEFGLSELSNADQRDDSPTQLQSLPAQHDVNYIDTGVGASANRNSMSFRWIFTIWPHQLPNGGEEWSPTDQANWPETPLYLCWGLETCPSTGRRHYHVYCRFHSKHRLRQFLNNFPEGALEGEMCEGTESQCRDYCWSMGGHVGKRACRIDYGEFNGDNFKADSGRQGARNDLDHSAHIIKQGGTLFDVAEAHPTTFIRYNQGIRAYQTIIAPLPPAIRDVLVYFLWGPTGTGKTTRVLQAFPDCYSVTRTNALQGHIWDEYTGQRVLLLDEWRSSAWTIQEMNRICDKFRLNLMSRYHNSYAAWQVVIICSNDTPTQSFPEEPELVRQAFQRRIQNRTYFVDKREDEGGPSLDFIMRHIDIPSLT